MAGDAPGSRIEGVEQVVSSFRRGEQVAHDAVAVGGAPDSYFAGPEREARAVGCAAEAAGNLSAADAHFSAAVEMNPKDLWPNFYHARAAYQLEDYEEAVTAFTVCLVLADRAPWCYYNRGLANAQLARNDAARRDFDRALDLDPKLAAAALDRGMLSYRDGRYDEALIDLQRARSDGADAGSVAYGLAERNSATEQCERPDKGDRWVLELDRVQNTLCHEFVRDHSRSRAGRRRPGLLDCQDGQSRHSGSKRRQRR
ncbi:MAG TPA: tetratricopeptide repeat protein [Pirellulales bacterium]|nr:tetratricopeptide repeat protein [Pirellulales bacterium]